MTGGQGVVGSNPAVPTSETTLTGPEQPRSVSSTERPAAMTNSTLAETRRLGPTVGKDTIDHAAYDLVIAGD